MDGAGSRLGRASSRYGPTPVFTGPVRRWKKQWVNLSSSSSTLSHHTTAFNSNGNGNAKAVRLPRWTPVSSPSSSDTVKSEEPPPRRKLRYTPIVVLEEKKKNNAKGADEESRLQSITMEKRAVDNMEETEISDRKGAASMSLNRSRLDLDLSLNGNDDDIDNDSDGENS